jgi:plasmid stabilization system protein ParE
MPVEYRILLANRAATDLERIFDHIAQESPRIAATVIERILKSMD